MLVKKYTYLFILFSFVIASLFALVNYVVDPYMLFLSKRIPGFNEKKPATANRSALYKPYNVTTIRPQTIVVGNSRPEMGIDPESPCWPEQNGLVYNLTFPGRTTYGQVRSLFHAVATDQIQHILLGVDFADFLHSKRKLKAVVWPKRNSDFFNRLLVDETFAENKRYWLSKIKDFSTSLFSLNALNDSIYTLISQSPDVTDRTSLGFNPARDYHKIIRHEGEWVLFEQKLTEMKKRFSKPEQSIYDSRLWSEEFEALRRVMQLTARKNIQLIIFINPYHYSYLETIYASGYWREFESFKRSLSETVDLYGKGLVALWDFALYSKFTVSPVPKKGVEEQVYSWFWEPAHYKAELGELMLSDLFGLNCVKGDRGPVGVNLNEVNIENHLLKQQEQRSTFLQQID